MSDKSKPAPVLWAVLVACLVWVCLFLPLVNTPFGSLNVVSASRMLYEMSGFHRGGFGGLVFDAVWEAPFVSIAIFYVFGAFAFVGVAGLRGVAYNRLALSAGSVGIVVFVVACLYVARSLAPGQGGRGTSMEFGDIVQFIGIGVWAWLVLCVAAVVCGNRGLRASFSTTSGTTPVVGATASVSAPAAEDSKGA